MDRNLDLCHFRVNRDGEWCNVCFSDLSYPEREKVCEGRSAEWLQKLAYHLADRLRIVGDVFDITGDSDD